MRTQIVRWGDKGRVSAFTSGKSGIATKNHKRHIKIQRGERTAKDAKHAKEEKSKRAKSFEGSRAGEQIIYDVNKSQQTDDKTFGLKFCKPGKAGCS